MEDLSGFLVINKPRGLTSHDCVSRVRKALGIKRVGHGGTLDPEVTGVLPIAVGKATRLLPFLPTEKSYLGTIQLGLQTTTDDLQGEVLFQKDWPKISTDEVDAYLDTFRGSIQQIPPQFSSVHINGKRAYELARSGKTIEIKPRIITVHSLQLIEWLSKEGKLKVKIHCSSGTYIRALARDLGKKIGCHGCLEKLKRTQALGFYEKQSIPLPNEVCLEKDFRSNIIPPINALNHLSSLVLTQEENKKWQTGCIIYPKKEKLDSRIYSASELETSSEYIAIVDKSKQVVGIGQKTENLGIKPKVVLNAI